MSGLVVSPGVGVSSFLERFLLLASHVSTVGVAESPSSFFLFPSLSLATEKEFKCYKPYPTIKIVCVIFRLL